jgi:hypothetical protein
MLEKRHNSVGGISEDYHEFHSIRVALIPMHHN